MWSNHSRGNLRDRPFRCRKCAFGTDIKQIDGRFTGPFSVKDVLVWHDPGNVFKCPLGICSREDLSFQEFHSHECCESQSESGEIQEYNDAEKIDHDYIEKIVKVHKKLGHLQIQAKNKYERSKKVFEEAQKELENNETKLKNTEARNQMRTLFCTDFNCNHRR